jgi:integrase
MASIARRPDGTWRPRYRDAEGKEHARHFARKADAQRWLDEVTATVVTGMYVDPKARRITLSAFYATWAARQVWAPSTELTMSLAVRSATFRDVELRSLRRSHVEQWVKHMVAAGLAPGTVHTRVQNVRSVLRGAVRDRLLASDPSEGVPLPRRRRRAQAMTIPTPAQVGGLLAAADERFATFIALCAFAGVRLGEAAAVQVDDIDFLRRRLAVRRQVQRVPAAPSSSARPSTARSGPSPSRTHCLGYWPGTSSTTTRTTTPTAGSSGRRTGRRRTRTPSATSGAGRPGPADWRASGCTTSGTSTPPVCEHHAGHLQPSLAGRRRPHPDRSRASHRRGTSRSCGLGADQRRSESR